MIFYSLLELFLLDPSVGGRGGEGGVEEALSSREGGRLLLEKWPRPQSV